MASHYMQKINFSQANTSIPVLFFPYTYYKFIVHRRLKITFFWHISLNQRIVYALKKQENHRKAKCPVDIFKWHPEKQ